MVTRWFTGLWRLVFKRQSDAIMAALPAARPRSNAVCDRDRAAQMSAPQALIAYAGDADPLVRQAVAGNIHAPHEANLLLVEDRQEEVRAELARKIARLLPDLPGSEVETLREQTIALMERLARDSTVRVRQTLAEEIRTSEAIPKSLVWDLARDVEIAVAGPILEFSPLLTDADLIELIAAARADTALSAIARRGSLSADVSDELAASLEIPAIASLLANPSAEIREDTLDRIIDQAQSVEALHEPLAMRPDLSVRAVNRITGFVTTKLVERLADRYRLSEIAQDALKGETRATVKRDMTGPDSQSRAEDAAAMVARAQAKGLLTAEFVLEAVGRGERAIVSAALCALTGTAQRPIDRILRSQSGKSITALCWRAGLPMRAAIEIQRKLGRVAPNDILLARNGKDYPLSEDDMRWQLEFFDVA